MNMLARAHELKDEFIAYRRDFHQHPELGFEEVRTSGIVAKYLEGLGIEVTRMVDTAVVGLLRGGKPGRTVALRADMDALSIPQQNDVPYKSIYPGKMHACGHDGHTAILMGVAKMLSEIRDEISGNVKFLFQPAEEGPGGALPMVEAGAMENPHVDGVLGLHVGVNLPTGQIGYRSGVNSAGTDTIYITINGKGGHGAHPHSAVDSIVAASHLVVALQTIVSREMDPLGSAVVTVGTFNGGYRNNVIAHQVELTGTVRTLDPQVRAGMPERIERIIKGICATFNCGYEFTYDKGYPSVINDPQMTELAKTAAERLLGAENVMYIPNPGMGGEDFSYFAEKAPGIFLRLGAGNPEKDCVYSGHHPHFNFDEDAIPVGMAVMAETALDFLKQG